MKIDLHVHTTFSDGRLNPKQLLELYSKHEYKCISITDHDDISGYQEAINLAPEYGIELIPGVEISTLYKGQDIHILAYYFDQHNKELIEALDFIHKARIVRAKKIIDKLDEIWGFKIEMSYLFELSGRKDIIGRPHIAQAMIDFGYCKDNREVFDKYIGDHCKANFPKESISPQEAISIIKNAGGVSSIAHPMKIQNNEIVNEIIDLGIDGLEVYYKFLHESERLYYTNLAQKFGLLMTGGSDFHGMENDYISFGEYSTPEESLQKLKQRVGRI